jgi:WD40 repeat protein
VAKRAGWRGLVTQRAHAAAYSHAYSHAAALFPAQVTGVTWSPTDFCTIATASDDQTVRIWKVNRELGCASVGHVVSEQAPESTAPVAPQREAPRVETPATVRQLPATVGPTRRPDLRQYFHPIPSLSSAASPATPGSSTSPAATTTPACTGAGASSSSTSTLANGSPGRGHCEPTTTTPAATQGASGRSHTP